MKILLVEDTAREMQNALEVLKGHEVTTVTSYDDAELLLLGGRRSDDPEYGHDTNIQAGKECGMKFDLVLTDLMLPAGVIRLNEEGRRHRGEQMPLGMFVAMLAFRLGIKLVAVVTDTDHHSHPCASALDGLSGLVPHCIGDATLVCTSRRLIGSDGYRSGGKDWESAFYALVGGRFSEEQVNSHVQQRYQEPERILKNRYHHLRQEARIEMAKGLSREEM